MSKVARIKTALLTALLWTLEVLGALALAGFLALLVYVLLLRLGLALERAASIAVSLWPAFVVAIFTVALWRSTQAQAKATRAMQELQKKIASYDLEPFLGVRLIKDYFGGIEGEIWRLEISNLGNYGVLLVNAYWLESCSPGITRQNSVKLLGLKSLFPLALPSGKTKIVFDLSFLDNLLKKKKLGELGCLVLLLFYRGKSFLRCYSTVKVEDAVIRLVYEPINPQAFFREEENMNIEGNVDADRSIAVHSIALKERDCPHDLAALSNLSQFA